MKHERHFQFSNAQRAEMDDFHLQLGELSDFLWNDPRPHAEGKFEMKVIATGWNFYLDDANQALARCGTAACACGWEIFRSGDMDLFRRSADILGQSTHDWMFAGSWYYLDNTPFGASFRIDHYL
ncbi:MAG: hypothetical protein AAGK66_07375, partial [Pseudomonadota bacterium]